MIDIHCHILPVIDDGPKTLAEALGMARLAVADGVKTIFATPHISPQGLHREEVAAATTSLQEAVTAAGLDLRLLPGGDCSSHLDTDALCAHLLHDGPYLLLEFPHTYLPGDAAEQVFELTTRGIVPIITHPERNADVLRNPKLMEPILEAGGLVQMTCESLTGGFGAESRACARHFLRQGCVHFLASDGHSTSWRQPVLSDGLKVATKLLGAARANALVIDNPACLVSGEKLGGDVASCP
jgi:protein-tyrosine phosphatase